jgi:hypothetical protein
VEDATQPLRTSAVTDTRAKTGMMRRVFDSIVSIP